MDWINIRCFNESSFDIFPDLTDYIDITGITIINCMLSINNTLNGLTTKTLKQVKNIKIYLKEEEEFTLNKNMFDGLSKLESLIIQFRPFCNMQLSNNIFEHLKQLVLGNVQISKD